MQADTHRPVERWNENHEPQRNAAELLALAPTAGAPGASRAGVVFRGPLSFGGPRRMRHKPRNKTKSSSSRPIPVTGPWIRHHLPATRQCETSGHFFSSSAAHLVVLSVWHVVQGLEILNWSVIDGGINLKVWLRTFTLAIVCAIFGMWQFTHSLPVDAAK